MTARIFLLIMILCAPFFIIPQDIPKSPEFLRDESGKITGVLLDDTYYFIKIVPADTIRTVPMPLYAPHKWWRYFGDDSLHYILPDSLLRYLPDSLRVPREDYDE